MSFVAKRIITFDELAHSYKDEYGSDYISVTTLIDKFAPKFDKEYWSLKKAAEYGITQQQVLAQWEEETKKSHIRGNGEHKLIENSVNSSKGIDTNTQQEKLYRIGKPKNSIEDVFTNIDLFILENSELANKYPEIFDFIAEKIRQGFKCYVEKRVYVSGVLLAGTIDCLLVKNGYFIIVDWKTNKDELSFKSGYYKKVNGIKSNKWVDKDERFFKPIDNLQVCKGVKYTLQLSMYALMCELWGMKCIGLYLYHIRMKPIVNSLGQGDFDTVLKLYMIDYLKEDCTKIINFLLQGKGVVLMNDNNFINL